MIKLPLFRIRDRLWGREAAALPAAETRRVGGSAHMAYRPDIDGLRAVAVLAVIAFHANNSWLPGGFAGVDIFFVISGYLITSIIVAEIKAGSFTLIGFYERRIRRLTPSLACVLVVTLALACYVQTPFDFSRTAKTALFALGFISNFHFALRGDYFDTALHQEPLLHTWSLAVEEQFYMLWPIVAFLVLRYTRLSLGWVVAAAAAASFAMCVDLTASTPRQAFYHPQVRVWELFLGALVALNFFGVPKSLGLAQAGAACGAVMIGSALAVLSPELGFPGPWAALPAVGAALVIWSGTQQRTVVASAMSLRPLVFVGLISYALYLWHWPLLALARYHLSRELEPQELALVLSSAFVLSVLCWRYLETPFRRRDGTFSRWTAIGSATLATAALAGFAGAAVVSKGFLDRFPAEIAELQKTSYGLDDSDCVAGRASAERGRGPCPLSTGRNADRNVLVWGDSHARALTPTVKLLGERFGVSTQFAGFEGCPPLLDLIIHQQQSITDACIAFNSKIYDLIAKGEITDVLLVAAWDVYVRHPGVDARGARYRFLTDAASKEVSEEESRRAYRRAIERSIGRLNQTKARIWIVEQTPRLDVHVPNYMVRGLMHGRPAATAGPLPADLNRQKAYFREIVAPFAKQDVVRVVDVARELCEAGKCLIQVNGHPLFADNHHLSILGAERIAPALASVFKPAQLSARQPLQPSLR